MIARSRKRLLADRRSFVLLPLFQRKFCILNAAMADVTIFIVWSPRVRNIVSSSFLSLATCAS